MFSRNKTIFVGILAVILVTIAFAEDSSAPSAEKPLVMLGPGVVISEKAQKGADTEVIPIPLMLVEWGRLRIFGPQATFTFLGDRDASLSALVKMRSEGYNAKEGRNLRGMDDRDRTVEGGLAYQMNLDWATLGVEWTSDLLKEHGGHEVRWTLSRRFDNMLNIQRLAITPTVGANWRSKQLNDYYYGVEAHEATAARPKYNVGDSFGLLAGIRAEAPLWQNWTLFTSVFSEWLDEEITDSPIVDKHYRLTIIAGAMYKF